MKSILLAEDDPDIVRLLQLHLSEPAYALQAYGTGPEALKAAASQPFDLIILDITLPGLDGMEICKAVRKEDAATPIMMLTGLSGESDKVLALDLGADAYVTKPFGILELLARIKALLRRGEQGKGLAANAPSAPIHFRELCIDKDKRRASIREARLDLTPKEFDLLTLLAENPGKSFTRHELLETVWGIAFAGYEHTVTAHINRLRLKIEPAPAKPEYILTAWGTGYRFAE